jgi:hypothetical protein
MKTTILIATTALFFGAPLVHSQEPKSPAAMMPKPVAEHEWLKKLVGQWETTTECSIEPGKQPEKGSGPETVRALGGFWVIAEGKAEMMGNPMQYIMTLGYDPKAGEYVGTWVDSMTGMLWKYTGSVDDTGRILALESEGGCPMNPGHVTRCDRVQIRRPPHILLLHARRGRQVGHHGPRRGSAEEVAGLARRELAEAADEGNSAM